MTSMDGAIGQIDRFETELKRVDEARAALDFWEHYSDHPGFIAEQGGQEAYDAEYRRRAQAYFELSTIPAKPNSDTAEL